MCLAVPGKVVAIADPVRHIAKVEVAGGPPRDVNIGLLTGDQYPAVGDYVLIHVGFALSRIDEQEAQETLRLLESIGGADAGEDSADQGSERQLMSGGVRR
ncbi:MAG: HypC/HybG/HupF family hydrogenase formation chaperone [Candidatus Dormiibacterota bacterium]